MWILIILTVIVGSILLVHLFTKETEEYDAKKPNNKKELKVQEHEEFNRYILISFLVPLAGLIMGSIFMTKDDKLDKKLGTTMLSVSTLSSILLTLIWFLLTSQSLNSL